MASVWGIDIGKAALKAVKLRRTREGLEIQAIEHIPYPIEDDEDERQEHVNDALRSFLSKHRIGSDTVVVGIPGQHALSRFIQLPPVDRSKLAVMVRMEAQQQIPFPISEVNWDFVQLPQEEPGGEVEVGIFATRSELIDGFLADMQEHGLQPDIVTIVPLAIYNFVRHNGGEFDEATVILDIGAEHTDLVIVDGERFWIRNLRIAGNDITKALAERFKIPFAEAEKLKRSSSKSPQARKIFSAMKPVLKDLLGEIHRSVGFFKSQAEDLDVKRMILLGDGAKLKNLTKFFKEELGYPVTRVQRLEEESFIIDPDVDLDVLKKHLLGLAVPLGLAVQGAGEARCAVNLAPQTLQLQAQLKAKLPLALATVVCSWLALGLSYSYWTSNRDALGRTLKSIKKLNAYQAIQAEAEGLKDFAKEEKAARELAALGEGRLLMLDFLDALGQELPKENGALTPLPADLRRGPVNKQIDYLLEQEARRKKNDRRLWLLDLDVGTVSMDERRGYKVVLTVAKSYDRGNVEPSAVREEIKASFVAGLRSRLTDAPFYVRTGPSASEYGDMTVSTPQIAYGLNPANREDRDTGALECVFVTVSFEIGFPPPEAPKPPAEGEEGGE
ncbi:MAG: type IV pilus assembly protein PilM [Planctomycetota bacterium]|nr:MAG: type IV pilus assembly protein PilM [Planctomycetota bacterium]